LEEAEQGCSEGLSEVLEEVFWRFVGNICRFVVKGNLDEVFERNF
jgi:hypothetical protein